MIDLEWLKEQKISPALQHIANEVHDLQQQLFGPAGNPQTVPAVQDPDEVRSDMNASFGVSVATASENDAAASKSDVTE